MTLARPAGGLAWCVSLRYRYQLFWLTLLPCKLYCSYLFQIQPLVKPTVKFLATSAGSEGAQQYALAFACPGLSLPISSEPRLVCGVGG